MTINKEKKEILEKFEKKEKEIEKLANALSKSRRENKILREKIDGEVQTQDYIFLKEEVSRLTLENSKLKSEIKGLEGYFYKF